MNRTTIIAALTAGLATAAIAAPGPAAAGTAPVAMPGMAIFQNHGAATSRCTLGYAASNARHDQLAVTAGHCGTVGTDVRDDRGNVIGTYAAVQPDDVSGHIYGYSIIKLRNTVATSAAVTRTLDLRQLGQAAGGDRVCLFGTTSGRKCGTVSAITAQAGAIDGFLSDHGDSGGPIVRVTDHALVGILISHSDDQGLTYFEPIANIHRLTSADGAGGPDFGAVIGN